MVWKAFLGTLVNQAASAALEVDLDRDWYALGERRTFAEEMDMRLREEKSEEDAVKNAHRAPPSPKRRKTG